MRQFLRTILRILDGSPSVNMATRNRQRGQSILELAFITPLLAILVAGAVEVGWYTNRWLGLLEVTRVGARSATFLTNELSPVEWNNAASVVPAIQTTFMGVLPGEESYNRAITARNCETNSNFGFYSFISCLMISSLEPLELDIDLVDPLDVDDEATEREEERPNGQRNLTIAPDRDWLSYDDIVISVFAIQNVNNAQYVGDEANNEGVAFGRPIYRTFQTPPQFVDEDSNEYKVTYNFNDLSSRTYPPGLQNIVVGRYPTNANECTHKGTYAGDIQLLAETDPGFEIDPFDYLDLDNGAVTESRTYGVSPNFFSYVLELSAEDGSPLSDNGNEFQRGFAFTGQHRIDDPNIFCFGSEFSVRDVEELINLPGFIAPDLYNPPSNDTSSPTYVDWVNDEVYAVRSQDERRFFEPQGMTLVEIFWKHDLLLRFPFFRPVTGAFGDEDEIIIALWSAFPLPSAAPNITYQLP